MDTTRYPIGIQTFEILRREGYKYVDKTAYVYRLVQGSRTYFLGRPRRFGKSLLLSTLEAYFQGRKELFEGLAIYDLEKEWGSYPVLRFDFSRAQAMSAQSLTNFIANRLTEYERKYNVTETAGIEEVGDRFGTLIESIYTLTGKQVVVLIDEYDKGIHEVLANESQLRANEDVMRPFFSQIKAQEQYLRFCFITGVARFRNYTLFSGFNNPNDISMKAAYAGICGITEQELIDNFGMGIRALAEKEKTSVEYTLERLRQKYDGYRFTESDQLVYNPFSILNCLESQKMEDYWITSGTPRVFVDYLSKSQFQILELEDLWVDKKRMESAYSTEDPIPILFQTGYLTIREYAEGFYKLGIPNGEVSSALLDDLMPKYMGIKRDTIPSMIVKLRRCLKSGDIDGLMPLLQSLVAEIPYHEMDMSNLEKTYHLVVYELFLIIGVDARSEVAMSGGRIDMVVQNPDYVYVMEFKLGGTADEALKQIDDRGYALPWSADDRQVYKVGVVFSSETRTLSDWKSIKA